MREFYLNFKFRLAIFAVFWRLGFILNLDQLFLQSFGVSPGLPFIVIIKMSLRRAATYHQR